MLRIPWKHPASAATFAISPRVTSVQNDTMPVPRNPTVELQGVLIPYREWKQCLGTQWIRKTRNWLILTYESMDGTYTIVLLFVRIYHHDSKQSTKIYGQG